MQRMFRDTNWRRLAAILIVPTMAACAALVATEGRGAESWSHPAIARHGKIRPMPSAEMRPRPDASYRVVLDVTEGAEDPSKVNDSLDKVARTVNLFAAAGTEPKLVVVVHGDATFSMLANEPYRAELGVDNPNLALLRSLHARGVTLYVCGQALAHRKLDPDQLAPESKAVQAAITATARLQHDGYHLQRL